MKKHYYIVVFGDNSDAWEDFFAGSVCVKADSKQQAVELAGKELKLSDWGMNRCEAVYDCGTRKPEL